MLSGPHSTPLRDPSRSFAPRYPLATSSRPVLPACGSRRVSRLSFTLKSQTTSDHYNRGRELLLYASHYKLPIYIYAALSAFRPFRQSFQLPFRSRATLADARKTRDRDRYNFNDSDRSSYRHRVRVEVLGEIARDLTARAKSFRRTSE